MFRTDSGARTALRLLHEAVALDPTYAAAWEGLSRVYARLVLSPRNTTSDREQYSALAYEAALKAVSLDDSLAEARAALGLARMISFDFAAAEQELLRALAMAPTRADTHDKLVWLYLWMDRPAEALEHARRAVQLDPLSPGARAALAQALLGNDQCDEALAELDKVLRVQPPLLRAGSIAAQCYARKQRWPEATAVLRAQFETGEPTAVGLVAFLQARGGQRAEALRIREALIERWRRGAIGAFGLALADAGLGNLDNAVEWLDRSLLDRSLIGVGNNPAHIMVMGPLLEDLRHHREFARLRPRLGLLLSRGAP
jgi:tetratricopeptide (TPR) repeat protein